MFRQAVAYDSSIMYPSIFSCNEIGKRSVAEDKSSEWYVSQDPMKRVIPSWSNVISSGMFDSKLKRASCKGLKAL